MALRKNIGSRYLFGAASDRGSVREHNEDSYDIFGPETDDLVGTLGILAIVSDGMGGHLSGAEASRKSVEVMGQVYFEGTGGSAVSRARHEAGGDVCREPLGVPEAAAINRLRWAFLEANRQVFEQVGEGHNGMAGTTCTAIVFLPETIHIAHAGDSRAYLLRGGNIKQLTNDHSVVGEMVRKGMLSREEATKHPHRNIITRAVGLRGNLEVDIEESIPVERGDRVIICSDGLFSMLDDREIAGIAARGTPEKACHTLIKRAKEEGGSDNITVIIAEKIE